MMQKVSAPGFSQFETNGTPIEARRRRAFSPRGGEQVELDVK
jgi:hypothetical protein